MFEQEIEMEKKEGSSFGPVLIIFLLVALFVGGIGVVVYQSRQTVKPEEATAFVQSKLTSTPAVSVTFHTGKVSYANMEKPSDPQYRLLEKAGYIKISKLPVKDFAAQVELTPAGKEFLNTVPGTRSEAEEKDSVRYTVPLASRKLVSVGAITKVTPQRFQVQYTWAWQPTPAGELFDIAGKAVQILASYERSMLIDQHGANYYHAAPTQSAIYVLKGDKGWELGN